MPGSRVSEGSTAGIRPPAPSESAETGPPATPRPTAVDGGNEPGGRWRRELWWLVELFALCGFVVVQPLLDIIGRSPDFFIFHGVETPQIIALLAIMVLVPPLTLWAVGLLIGLVGSQARRWAHLVTVAVLALLLLIQLGKHITPVRGVLLVAGALVLATVVMVGYLRLSAARQVLRVAAVGPLVFVLLFSFASPASAVLLASDRAEAGAVPAATVGSHPPIVMIILDELALVSLLDDDGMVDAERFPNFARLADDSTWYRNATTTSGWTPYAIPSILTGQWPAEHVAPHYAIYEDNLFTLLGETHRITANESIAQLCPPWHCDDRGRSRGGLPVALGETAALWTELISPVDRKRTTHDDFAEPTVAERLGAAAAAREQSPDFRFGVALSASQPVRFHDFLTALADEPWPSESEEGQPPLHFLHLLMPHTPWTYYPDGMRYSNVQLPVDGEWWGRLAHQRYELQLRYTDSLIGQVLDTMQQIGIYDDALLVLTSDHGVTLSPGRAGIRELGPDEPGIVELAWVPLFIKEPGQTTGRIEDGNWQHVDLLPTVADLAGVEVPWEVAGISWRDAERTTSEKPFYPTLDEPGVIDGPTGYAQLLADPFAYPLVPPAPLPELVGTEVADHPVVDGPSRVTLVNPEAYAAVDLGSGVVPGIVQANVAGGVPEGTPVAIALNGRIVTVAPVVSGDDGDRVVGLVPDPTWFVDGANQVEFFQVTDGGTLQRS